MITKKSQDDQKWCVYFVQKSDLYKIQAYLGESCSSGGGVGGGEWGGCRGKGGKGIIIPKFGVSIVLTFTFFFVNLGLYLPFLVK